MGHLAQNVVLNQIIYLKSLDLPNFYVVIINVSSVWRAKAKVLYQKNCALKSKNQIFIILEVLRQSV